MKNICVMLAIAAVAVTSTVTAGGCGCRRKPVPNQQPQAAQNAAPQRQQYPAKKPINKPLPRRVPPTR